jgi:uncharacterized protein YggE
MSRLALIAGAIAVCCAAAPARAQNPQPNDPPSIVATGEALVTVAPDRALIEISADGHAKKAADAQRLAAESMTSVQNALKSAGVAADAIKTTGYSLTPEYDYVSGQQQFRDYLARNQIEVRVDDLSKLSAVIDASGAAGAATVSGLRFDLKARATVEQSALKDAVADAMARAGSIAAGANRTLGSIIRISEQRISEPVTMRYMTAVAGGRAGGGAPTPIEPGEINVRAQVTVTVAIK